MSRQRSMEVIEQSEYVTIGELVRLTGVRYSTLKFYTEEGMLPFEQAEIEVSNREKEMHTYKGALNIPRGKRALFFRFQGEGTVDFHSFELMKDKNWKKEK